MTTSPLLRKAALIFILLLTIGFTHRFTTTVSQGAAIDSPLPTPWPTVVVTYQATLPTARPTLAATVTAVASNFFRSPLPTPTALPDAEPPRTALSVQGAQTNNDWYRSPVTLTFAITDNIAAGVTEYQLAEDAAWTSREYYYPLVTLAEEGMHTVAYRSLDWAKNREATQNTQIRIDHTPPLADEPGIDGNQLANGWYNTPVTVTLHGQDALAGLAGFEMVHAAGGWTVGAATTIITTTTQQTLTWRAVDNAGNVSSAQTLALLVDMTPPTTTHTIAPLPSGGWYSTPVTVSLTALDEGSGLFQTDYRLDNGAAWQRYAAPFAITSDGLHTIDYQSSDRALNREGVNTFTLSLDRTPPTISTSVEGQPLAPGWYRADASLVATATDTLAGLATFDYQTDNGLWQPYNAPLAMPVGQQSLHLRARDRAGNSTTSTHTLGVDTQPPTTTLQFTPQPNAAGWHNQPVTVTLVATDTASGLYQTQYQWQDADSPAIYQQPFQLAQEGATTLTWFSIDRTLNQEAPQTHTFAVDWTAPLITYTVTGDSVAPGWYRSAVQVTISPTDTLAGVAQVDYAMGDGPWQSYTTTLTLRHDEKQALQSRVRDAANNQRMVTTPAFAIDRQPPRSTIALTGSAAPSGWYRTPVTVTLTTTDTESGPATIHWRLNGGPWQAYGAPFAVSNERVNLLDYYAVDQAGNEEAAHYEIFSIDLVDPTSRVGMVQGELGINEWYVSPVTLTLSAQDLESGLELIEYTLDGDAWQLYTTPVVLADEGIHHLHYRATDSGGRIEATRTLTISLDLTPPVIVSTLPPTVTTSGVTLTAFYTATDDLSGVVTTTLLLNGQPYQPGQSLRFGSNLVEIQAWNGAGLVVKREEEIIVMEQQLYLPLIQR